MDTASLLGLIFGMGYIVIVISIGFLLALSGGKKGKSKDDNLFGIFEDNETPASIDGVESWTEKDRVVKKTRVLKALKNKIDITFTTLSKHAITVTKYDIKQYGYDKIKKNYYIELNNGKLHLISHDTFTKITEKLAKGKNIQS